MACMWHCTAAQATRGRPTAVRCTPVAGRWLTSASCCTHPTGLQVVDKCIVCPAHGTAFSLESGAVAGKWCPSLPEAVSTGFGLTPPKPLPVFPARVTEAGDIEIDI
jgi:nitrite reductase/ring-hydroxylating ferredoxin subunit